MVGLASPLAKPLARGLALPLTDPEGVGMWWDSLAVFDADFSANRFRWNGQTYNDETAFLAAVGGSKSGITRTIGPYVSGAEILVNGDFSDMTGWSGQLSGTIAQVGGECELTGNGGNTPGYSRSVTCALSKAYQFQGTHRRGTSTISNLAVSVNANLSAALVRGTDNSTTTNRTDLINFSAENTTMKVGGQIFLNPGNGTAYFDNLGVKEIVPFSGWVSGQATVVLSGTAPATHASKKVLWQSDGGGSGERSRLRLERNTSGNLVAIATWANAATASLDLGNVADSAAFTVAFSAANGSFAASLNGATAVTSSGGQIPGVGIMRVGRSVTGETWDGTIDRCYVRPNSSAAAVVENLSGSDLFVAWGDSITDGSGASGAAQGYPALLAVSSGKAVAERGTGGETSTQIKDRVIADTTYRGRISILEMGRNDFTSSAAVVKANIATSIAYSTNSKYIVTSILPATTDGDLASATSIARTTLNSDLATLYGARFFDPLVALQAAGDGSGNDNSDIANGWTPRSLRASAGSDPIHLNDAGYAVYATALQAFITGLGW